jgi:hypothetical protein
MIVLIDILRVVAGIAIACLLLALCKKTLG